MRYSEYKYLVYTDLYRLDGNGTLLNFIYQLLIGESFKYIFWMRTCKFSRKSTFVKYFVYPLARLMLKRYYYKLGISIPYNTNIDSGFYIGHFGGIVIHPLCNIGKNCNLSHGVTIGQTNRGKRKGVPAIGDNVYIGPGAKVIGGIKIGDHACIGANCVVTKDVPDYAVVAGVPGQVRSLNGSENYIINTGY